MNKSELSAKPFFTNQNYLPKKSWSVLFLAGCLVSCVAEIILIIHATNVSLFYFEVLGYGLGLATSVGLLIAGNLMMLVDYNMTKPQRC